MRQILVPLLVSMLILTWCWTIHNPNFSEEKTTSPLKESSLVNDHTTTWSVAEEPYRVPVENAIYRMQMHDYISWDAIDTYAYNTLLTKSHAASLLVHFARDQQARKHYTSEECQYSDIDTQTTQTQEAIIKSCQYGIFWNNDGLFHPDKIMTLAEALASIVRVVAWVQDEINVEDHRADNYYNLVKTRWRLDDTYREFYDLDWDISRWLFIRVLYDYSLGRLVNHEILGVPLTGYNLQDRRWHYTGLDLYPASNHFQDRKDFSQLRLVPLEDSRTTAFDIVDVNNTGHLESIRVELPGFNTTMFSIARSPIYVGQGFNKSWYTYVGTNRQWYGEPGTSDYRLLQISYTGAIQQIFSFPYDAFASNYYYLLDEDVVLYDVWRNGEYIYYQYDIASGILSKVAQEQYTHYVTQRQENQQALDPDFGYLTLDKQNCDTRIETCVYWIWDSTYSTESPDNLHTYLHLSAIDKGLYLWYTRTRSDEARNWTTWRGLLDKSWIDALIGDRPIVEYSFRE